MTTTKEMATKASKTKVPAKPKPPAPDAPVTLAPSNIVPIAFARICRAPENVRKTNVAADVESLADDIAAHGLLQSLIGYTLNETIVEPTSVKGKSLVYIVGGGRRLQALQLLHERGVIDDRWPVSVLIRDQGEAIELSLSENLARRDMNPADEFEAFAALMKTGATNPAQLGKRFGFTERYVKQRLRLAALAPEILDALRNDEIGLESAITYARTPDVDLQQRVFKAQQKPNAYSPHSAYAIKSAYDADQLKTDSTVFEFIDPATYEAEGGGYEEDLFDSLVEGAPRRLSRGDLALAIAERCAALQGERVMADARAEHPSIVDFVLPKGLTMHGKIDAPAGHVAIRAGWNSDLAQYIDLHKVWSKIDELAVETQIVIYIGRQMVVPDDANDEERERIMAEGVKSVLMVNGSHIFVPKADAARVLPPKQQHSEEPGKTAEQIAAEARVGGVELWSQRLAVGPFKGTPLEGRTFWTSGYHGRPTRSRHGEVEGWSVPLHVFVTDEEVAAQQDAAEIRYDEWLAEEAERLAERERQQAAAAAAREAEETARASRLASDVAAIMALDDQPAVISVEDAYSNAPQPYFRQDNGAYTDEDDDTGYTDLAELLDNAQLIGGHWPTREAYDAAQAELVDEQATEDA